VDKLTVTYKSGYSDTGTCDTFAQLSNELVVLGDEEHDDEAAVYLSGDPDLPGLVDAARKVYGPSARAMPVKEFRKLAGEEALEEFPLLARYRGTTDYQPLLYLAETLMDGYIEGQIEMDLAEIPDDPDERAEWLEYMNRAGWIEDVYGHAVHEEPDEDEAELLPCARPGVLHWSAGFSLPDSDRRPVPEAERPLGRLFSFLCLDFPGHPGDGLDGHRPGYAVGHRRAQPDRGQRVGGQAPGPDAADHLGGGEWARYRRSAS
jgi:hypothetical protein